MTSPLLANQSVGLIYDLKSKAGLDVIVLADVLAVVRSFLLPLVDAADDALERTIWTSGQGWHSSESEEG